jgi:lysyl-tRNA synthetase class 2
MNSVKRGDIMGVQGFPGKSKKGELSVFPTSMQVGGGCVGGEWGRNAGGTWRQR